MSEPFAQECKNNGHGVGFTCPGCYHDLPHDDWCGRSGACPGCGRTIECTIEDEPVSVCRLAD